MTHLTPLTIWATCLLLILGGLGGLWARGVWG